MLMQPSLINQQQQFPIPKVKVEEPSIRLSETESLIQSKSLKKSKPEEPKHEIEPVKSQTNGHWTVEEHKAYLEFVEQYQDIMRSKYDKKSKKIFKMMSVQIPTRTPTQCRSHHQKFNPFMKKKKVKRTL